MTHDIDTLRADSDYELRRRNVSDSVWVLADKRTGHRWMFTHVTPNGYQNNVFLQRLSPFERNNDHTPSIGNRIAILDKASLPEWLIEEFESIHETGDATTPTDPR